MNTFNRLKKILDELPNNIERKKHIQSIRENPLIGKDELMKIACNIMYDDNFIDSYYKPTFEEFAKNRIKKVVIFLKRSGNT